jgi:hypothetical protein
MRRTLVLMLASALAQDTYSTFRDPAANFQFHYPAWWQLFTGKRIAEAASLSYIPLCSQASIACVVEPSGEFKNTNFEGASFQVAAIAGQNEAACLKVENSGLPPVRAVNGIQFVHGSASAVAAGHSLTAEIYRTFHGDACYEVRVSTAQASIAIAPGGTRKLSPLDADRLQKRLDDMLDSLRFLGRDAH